MGEPQYPQVLRHLLGMVRPYRPLSDLGLEDSTTWVTVIIPSGLSQLEAHGQRCPGELSVVREMSRALTRVQPQEGLELSEDG